MRIMHIDQDGIIRTGDDVAWLVPPPPGIVCWIDLDQPDRAMLELLGTRFGFHPLTIDDCTHFDQMPKLENYGDYVFLVTHAFSLVAPDNEDILTVELHSFLGAKYLITVHDAHLPALDTVWKRLQTDPRAGRRGPDFIRYLIAHELATELYPIAEQLSDDTEIVEGHLFGEASPRHVLQEIMRIKRLNVTLRKALIPQRNIMASLAQVEDKFISDKTTVYFRDVYDHLLRVTGSLESNREILESVLTGYQWAISQRTNEIVKRLTLLSAVFLPLTFVTGFFGQNFVAMPFDSKTLFVVMLSSCVVVPSLMLWFFLRRNWI